MDWLVVKTFLTMMLIVGLMFAVLIIVRKYFYSRPQFADDNMRIITSLSLQPKKSIYLVKMFGKMMIVGVTDNSIAALGEVTDPEALKTIQAADSRNRGKGFAGVLSSFMQPMKGNSQK